MIDQKTAPRDAPGVDFHIPSPPAYTPPPPVQSTTFSEVEWKTKLKQLEKKIRKYNRSKNGPSEASDIVESMRDLSTSHPDPQVQAYWNQRADAFEKAPDADRKSILLDVGRGLAILIAAPFAIVGALLIGTGMLLRASSNLITGGKVFPVDKMTRA